jgi:hypothetical protein
VLNIDLEFPHSYEIDEIPELPGTGRFDVPLFYFPRPTTRMEHDGLWLRIRTPNGKSWVGVFAFGYQSPSAFTGVVSTFDPDRVCIVAKGAAYIVNTAEPDTWEQVPIVPVTDLRSIAEDRLLLFADFTSLAAYSRNGLAWRSPRLCWDDLKILSVTEDSIEGMGYDPTDPSGESRFAVNKRTGQSLIAPPVSIDGKPLW